MAPADVRRAGLSLIPFVLVCLQLQIPTVALGPVIDVIRSDVGLTLAQAGALTSIPVFCFALLTPLASRLVAAFGINRAFVVAALGIGLGVVIRSSGSIAALYLGSVLLGSAIALTNIAIPTLITRRYRHRALLLSGIQTSSTNVGSAVAAAVSAPLVLALGWQLGLGIWSVISFAAAGVWWWRHGVGASSAPQVSDAVVPSEDARTTAQHAPGWRVPLAWVLGFVFVMHGICYFAVSSWLPLLLQERSGLSATAAGACVAVFMSLGIVGPLLLPVLLRAPRLKLWMLMTMTSLGWLVCVTLLAAVPDAWLAAVLVGGLVQGASFTVIVTFAVHVAADETQSRQIQATLQTVGFAGAAIGPILIGAVLDATGSWSAPLGVLVGVGVALVALGAVASRMLVAHDAVVARAAA